MIEHRAEFQTEPTLRRQEGIARDLWLHLAIAQDEVWQHGKHGLTRRALYPPNGDPTHTEADIMRVTGETRLRDRSPYGRAESRGRGGKRPRIPQRPCRCPAAASRSHRLENRQ